MIGGTYDIVPPSDKSLACWLNSFLCDKAKTNDQSVHPPHAACQKGTVETQEKTSSHQSSKYCDSAVNITLLSLIQRGIFESSQLFVV